MQDQRFGIGRGCEQHHCDPGERSTGVHRQRFVDPAPARGCKLAVHHLLRVREAGEKLDDREPGGYGQIHSLTPSAPAWDPYSTLGRLQRPPDDHHAKVLVHEFVHAVQRTILGPGRRCGAWPSWVTEAQAEVPGGTVRVRYSRAPAPGYRADVCRDAVCRTPRTGCDSARGVLRSQVLVGSRGISSRLRNPK